MWNDKIEATPKTSPSWIVPAFFLALAAAGGFALLLFQ